MGNDHHPADSSTFGVIEISKQAILALAGGRGGYRIYSSRSASWSFQEAARPLTSHSRPNLSGKSLSDHDCTVREDGDRTVTAIGHDTIDNGRIVHVLRTCFRDSPHVQTSRVTFERILSLRRCLPTRISKRSAASHSWYFRRREPEWHEQPPALLTSVMLCSGPCFVEARAV